MKRSNLIVVALIALASSAQAQTRFGADRLAEGQILMAAYLSGSKCPGLTTNVQGFLAAIGSRGLKMDDIMAYPSNREVERLVATFDANPATYCPKIESMFGPLGNVAAGVLSPK